jgi:hypothetical protein
MLAEVMSSSTAIPLRVLAAVLCATSTSAAIEFRDPIRGWSVRLPDGWTATPDAELVDFEEAHRRTTGQAIDYTVAWRAKEAGSDPPSLITVTLQAHKRPEAFERDVRFFHAALDTFRFERGLGYDPRPDEPDRDFTSACPGRTTSERRSPPGLARASRGCSPRPANGSAFVCEGGSQRG